MLKHPGNSVVNNKIEGQSYETNNKKVGLFVTKVFAKRITVIKMEG